MKEYGSYQPFECIKGQEYYSGEDVVSLNCARNAIVYAIMDAKYECVYIPFYLCNTVRLTLDKYQIKYKGYHFNNNLEPVDIKLSVREGLLYPNLFGLVSKDKINKIINLYRNVIIDNTQAFLSEPNLCVYNVYSCRKFFGVSDGAYVIKKGITHNKYPVDFSGRRIKHLFVSLEEGTNAAYKENMKAEEELSHSDILEMSSLTHMLLGIIDYESVIEARKRNYDTLNSCLKKYGFPDCKRSEECVPCKYPFWYEHEKAREILLNSQIYVPQWWNDLVETNEFECNMSKWLMPLPIDQRYSCLEIEQMAERIVSKFHENRIL